jgi:hypothetical protein
MVTLPEVFTMADQQARADDLRAIVLARMVALHGAEEGARAAAARLVAPRWGLAPDQAAERISRWLNRRREMTTDALFALLVVLGLTVVERPEE